MQLGANDVGHDRFGDLIHKSIGRGEPLRMCRSMHVCARIDPDVQDLGVQLGAALSRAASTQGAHGLELSALAQMGAVEV